VRRVLRWVGGRRAILPITARLLCARLVRESITFFAREVLRPPGVYVYTVRENGARIALRHGGVDSATLAEVFYHRYYHPPREVARALGVPGAILDLGANIGVFGAFAIHRWPQSTVVAYEPDPANAAVHERTVEANGADARWTLERAAAGAHSGEVRFAAGLGAGSHVLEAADAAEGEGSASAITVPLCDVLPRISDAELVKMDIEGGEWTILSDARFADQPPRAVVLEYHPHLCPSADPRAAAERALSAAGLRTAPIWHGDDGHGMLWAWRD
jgi:FkbM family methyltransferase